MSKQLLNLDSNNFKPFKDYILIKPDELLKEEKTETGLVLEVRRESVVERPTSGVVISVGVDVKDVKPGDHVIWPTEKGIDLAFIDGDFLLMYEDGIIGFRL